MRFLSSRRFRCRAVGLVCFLWRKAADSPGRRQPDLSGGVKSDVAHAVAGQTAHFSVDSPGLSIQDSDATGRSNRLGLTFHDASPDLAVRANGQTLDQISGQTIGPVEPFPNWPGLSWHI